MKCLKIQEKDVRYPKRLVDIRGHPQYLYIKGNEKLLRQEKIIAMVGSRKCSKQGAEEAKRFARYLSAQGICIISGMALGIDAMAHKAAMQEVGKTIAVLPSGFNHIYPKENIELYHQILENGGCVISEYEENQKVDMQNFSQRNRIIAGISQGVLVVEAKYRSGSSITARHAKIQQKPVFCIPKEIQNKYGVGSNRMIQKGAELITKPEEILDYYGFGTINPKVLEKQEIEEKIKIQKEYEKVYNAIEEIPTNINTIIKKSKITIEEGLSILTMLELEGVIRQLAGNYYEKIH